MRVLPKWLAKLIARLLPKQENSGEHSVLVGKAGGDVTVVHFTQHVHHRAQGSAAESTADRSPLHRTPQQVEVLRLMRGLKNRIPVLDFMDREFGTRMVIELTPVQLYRVKRYVETIREREKL